MRMMSWTRMAQAAMVTTPKLMGMRCHRTMKTPWMK